MKDLQRKKSIKAELGVRHLHGRLIKSLIGLTLHKLLIPILILIEFMLKNSVYRYSNYN